MNNLVVGFRFSPTDVEIVHNYLRPKNIDRNTLHVDGLINTVEICSFDPWELPSKSAITSGDMVWYFFCPKKMKYKTGDQQSRTTKSGFWKKNGLTLDIFRNGQKIGEKRFLAFRVDGSTSNWVMHEYHTTISSPNQMVTYTLCKVMFNGDEKEFSSYYPGGELDISHPQLNCGEGLGTETEGMSSLELIPSERPRSPLQLTGGSVDEVHWGINRLSSDDFDRLLDGDVEQGQVVSMQENLSNHMPKKPLAGTIDSTSDDDSDSDSISITTISTKRSSTCNSFGSSKHRIDQITDLEKINRYDGSLETETGGYKMGQEMNKDKRSCFMYRMIRRFIKKIQLCSSGSRT